MKTEESAIFDAHCHETDPLAYQRARQEGVDGWLWASLHPNDQAPPGVWRAYGLHPWSALELSLAECQEALGALEQRLELDRPEAVGEIGLDHVRARGSVQRQHARWVFLQQLELARRFRLPVVLHSVRCHALMVQLLRQADLPRKGLIHSFQGPAEWIQPYREVGYLLSLGPHSLGRLSQLPRVGILLETDAPARQTQLYQLAEVAREVADRLNLPVQELVSGCDQALRLLLHEGTERGNLGPGLEIINDEDSH